MKKQILITIYFDDKRDLSLEDRDHDRFIINLSEVEDFRDKFFEVIKSKRYSLDNKEEFKMGFKPIMAMEQINLYELEVL